MATEPETKEMWVQVANARTDNVGRGVVRVGSGILAELGVREGEPIEIIGERHTAAIAVPSYPKDEGLRIIRLDGLQQANAGVSSGDSVELRRVEAKPVRRISMVPAQKNLRL